MASQRFSIGILSAFLGLPTVAPAQLSVEAVTGNTVTVTATTTSRVRKTIPVNTDVSKGFSLTASSFTSCSATATAVFTVSNIFGGINAQFQNTTSASGNFFCGASALAGANDVVVTLKSPKPVAGRLILTIQILSGKNSSASGLVDVGNDGSPEIRGGQKTLDAVVGPKGLPVLLRGFGSATGTDVSNFVAAVLFVPTGGRFGVIGKPCGGPVFEAFYTGSLLQFQTSKAPAGPYALFAIGVKNWQVAIPPMNCILHTDILVAVGVPVTGGESLLKIPVTTPVRGTFRMQYLISSGGAWRTSNALSLKL